MKRSVKVILCLLCLVFAFACTHAEPTADSTDPLRANVTRSTFKLNRKTGSTLISVKTRLTNGSDAGIMEVQYTISVMDKQGVVLDQISAVYNGLDTPIAPGKSVVHETDWQEKLDGTPHHAEVTVKAVRSEAEVPPVHLPQRGEPLYQALNHSALSALPDTLPAKIEMWIDRGGSVSLATLTDEETIREAVGLFMDVRIGAETHEWVTDNYNGVSFTFADGETVSISLNLKSLEIHPYNAIRLYELENLTPFFNFMCDRAVPFNGSDSAGS